MGMHTTRARFGEPGHDLATSLGRLLVSTAQLRNMQAALLADDPDTWTPGEALANWTDFTSHLLELHDRIRDAAAVMRFSGSSGEHLTIAGGDGLRIPADASYISTLSRRMDRHARLGRLMLGTSTAQEAVAV